jgi:hypothetical protein
LIEIDSSIYIALEFDLEIEIEFWGGTEAESYIVDEGS